MNDIEGMSGKFDAPDRNGEMAVLTGIVPVASTRDYAKDVTAYTKGHGSLTCTLHGYLPAIIRRRLWKLSVMIRNVIWQIQPAQYSVRMAQDLWSRGISHGLYAFGKRIKTDKTSG